MGNEYGQNHFLRRSSALVNWVPGFMSEPEAVKKRRGFAIHAYIGANGSGKSATCCLDTLPTLKGIMWSCENPDHFHSSQGIYSGVRRVLSTMRFTTPDGEPHPLWIPLTDYSQLPTFEHGDLILDEVGGAVASSTGDDIPMSVKAVLQEMRRKEVNIRWTAPSWARASKVLRECSLGVTVSQGKFAVRDNDDVEFHGWHVTEYMDPETFQLVQGMCEIDGLHKHSAGRTWGSRRMFFTQTFDATQFDEWTSAKRDKMKPVVRQVIWRPGHELETAYDTHAHVNKLGQVTDSGRCDNCMGYKARRKCECGEQHETREQTRARIKAEKAAQLAAGNGQQVLTADPETTRIDVVTQST
jgi:hypothetical protein